MAGGALGRLEVRSNFPMGGGRLRVGGAGKLPNEGGAKLGARLPREGGGGGGDKEPIFNEGGGGKEPIFNEEGGGGGGSNPLFEELVKV